MRGFVISIAVFALFGGCEFKCSTGGFNTEKVQKKIEKTMADQGVEVKATCPEIKKNATTNCTAKTTDGKTIIVEVVTDGSKAKYETKNVAMGKKIAPRIQADYKDKYNLVMETFTCPNLIVSGDTVTCAGKAQGVDIPFKLSVDTKGIHWEPTAGVIVAAKIEPLLQKQLGGPAKVTCDFRIRVSKPGDRFACSADKPDGTKVVVHFKITDTNGGITMGLTPPE